MILIDKILMWALEMIFQKNALFQETLEPDYKFLFT